MTFKRSLGALLLASLAALMAGCIELPTVPEKLINDREITIHVRARTDTTAVDSTVTTLWP